MGLNKTNPAARRLIPFLAALVLVGFVVNEIWEVVQMFAYTRPPEATSMSEFGRCSRAAVGDVGIIVGICAIGALASGSLGWGWSGAWNVNATSFVLGLIWATVVERLALAENRWAYADSMPIVPILQVGVLPLLQMTLLPPLTLWLARAWATRGAQ